MAILELKAARQWAIAETAQRFLVEPATIAEWMRRVDEEGRSALVQIDEPVNRFPDFVRRMVRRLKVLCPTFGEADRLRLVVHRAEGLHGSALVWPEGLVLQDVEDLGVAIGAVEGGKARGRAVEVAAQVFCRG